MKLYCIIANFEENPNAQLLKKACEQQNVEFVELNPQSFDYTQDLERLIEIPSIVYRVTTGPEALLLEAMLLRRPGVIGTFYAEALQGPFLHSLPWGSTLLMQRAGLPIIPTIFNVTPDQQENLGKYVEQLGGFPVILKASGGSHGASVLQLDSLHALRSVLGYVVDNQDSARRPIFALRAFVHNATHIRMVVMGNQVADAIRYLPQPDDFRTNNVAEPQVTAYERTPDNEHLFELAVQAVHCIGFEFGGVDILLAQDGQAYIAEVNFPCNFSRNQLNTGTDVAGAMVTYLRKKATAASA